jgi:hypothetical protein
MNELSLLAQKYDTDKGVTGKRWGNTYHGFTEEYHDYLKHLRHEKFVLIEIGVGGYASGHDGGQSLGMWSEYFPNADIHGIDVYRKTMTGRFTIHQGSQDNPVFLTELVAKIGNPLIIVDDGSHIDSHLLASFNTLWPFLLPNGGLYIVEDLHVSYSTTEGEPSMLGLLLNLSYLLNHGLNPVLPEEYKEIKSINFHKGFAIIRK